MTRALSAVVVACASALAAVLCVCDPGRLNTLARFSCALARIRRATET
jgi:hypothetical protein